MRWQVHCITQVGGDAPMKIFYIAVALFPALFLSSCKGKDETQTAPAPASKFSVGQLASRFPYDLGPATVDISKYPAEIQKNYRLFLAVCSSCHTSARPLNAPYVKAYDWKRFTRRMHLKMEDRGFNLDRSQEKQIVEFLVYDAKIRKVDKKEEFNSQQESLKKLFEEVSKEKEKLVREKSLRLPTKEFNYVGVK